MKAASVTVSCFFNFETARNTESAPRCAFSCIEQNKIKNERRPFFGKCKKMGKDRLFAKTAMVGLFQLFNNRIS
jgi:hypothetical protein